MTNRCIATSRYLFEETTAKKSVVKYHKDSMMKLSSFSNGEKVVNGYVDQLPDSYSQPQELHRKYNNLPGRTVAISASSITGVETGVITNGFNVQTIKYVNALDTMQDILKRQTQEYMLKVYANNENPTASQLRNKGNWGNVKKLVIRDELMKLQIGGETDLPLTEPQLKELKSIIKSKDLSDFTDQELANIIDGILKPDERAMLEALKAFKYNGEISPLLQPEKLDALYNELKDINLDKISEKEFKHLVENYLERLEVHHRTSISSDPNKQSDINNLDTLNTTKHDEKHTYVNENGEKKINYKKPVEENELNRQKELKILNQKRVIKNELTGLASAALIGAGTGFAIGFVVSLAQNGLSVESLKNSFIVGKRAGVESGAMAGISYGISRTIGSKMAIGLTEIITERFGDSFAVSTLSNMAKMCSMGVVGTLSIMVASVYQFTKLKIAGYSTGECLIRTVKSAALSFSVLVVSIVAQGLWGGLAGIVVSVSAGVVLTGANVLNTRYDKEIRGKSCSIQLN